MANNRDLEPEKESRYMVMLRDEAKFWSIKFPVAPESTKAKDTVH